MIHNKIKKPALHIVGIRNIGRDANGRIYRFLEYCWLYYFAQMLWQRQALKVAKRLHAQERFDIIHHLNMIGYREPGYLWKLDKKVPFIWGPIGGFAQMPVAFLPSLNKTDRFVYAIRNIVNYFQMRFSFRVWCAMRRANMLIAATKNDQKSIERMFKRTPILINETGGELRVKEVCRNKFLKNNRLNIVWSGVFLGRKALQIGLCALQKAQQQMPPGSFRLTVLGKGPCGKAWKELAEKLGISELCEWHDWLPRDQAVELVRDSDVMLFTSLQEGTPHVVSEAIGHAVPVICHDCCGMGDFVTEKCGIKIPVVNPKVSIDGFCDAILGLAQSRDRLYELAKGSVERSVELSWENKGKQMIHVYEAALAKV